MQNGGLLCPDLVSTEVECNQQPCPIDCVLSEWSTWGTCSQICGGGNQTRHKEVLIGAAHGGTDCTEMHDVKTCNTQECNPCEIDNSEMQECTYSSFSEWGLCSKACGGGISTRTRVVVTPMACEGQLCPPLHDEQVCNSHDCPIHCEVGLFADWAVCSES